MEQRIAKEAILRAQLNEPLQEMCLKVIDSVSNLEPDDGKFLPLSFFSKKTNIDRPSELVGALNFLSSFEAAFLELHAYIVHHGEPLVIDDDDFKDFLRSGILVHPDDGRIMNDAPERLHLFYSIKEVQNERSDG